MGKETVLSLPFFVRGILFVLHTGIRWEFLPKELGFGSGMTCWRRLVEWHAARKLDWSRAVNDSSHVRALKGGPKTGPSPVDRARTGSKHHVLTDGHGTPLAVSLTGGNRNDATQLIPLLDKVPPVRGRVGRPRRRPHLLATTHPLILLGALKPPLQNAPTRTRKDSLPLAIRQRYQ